MLCSLLHQEITRRCPSTDLLTLTPCVPPPPPLPPAAPHHDPRAVPTSAPKPTPHTVPSMGLRHVPEALPLRLDLEPGRCLLFMGSALGRLFNLAIARLDPCFVPSTLQAQRGSLSLITRFLDAGTSPAPAVMLCSNRPARPQPRTPPKLSPIQPRCTRANTETWKQLCKASPT